ncbi:MAG: hypothetical protein AAF542_04105 [Pseudomonadota bacterium]
MNTRSRWLRLTAAGGALCAIVSTANAHHGPAQDAALAAVGFALMMLGILIATVTLALERRASLPTFIEFIHQRWPRFSKRLTQFKART